ncbi:LOW QUALITY PROTEIN: vitelline membrane outer layer protein 1-like [Acridotheres tristis]
MASSAGTFLSLSEMVRRKGKQGRNNIARTLLQATISLRNVPSSFFPLHPQVLRALEVPQPVQGRRLSQRWQAVSRSSTEQPGALPGSFVDTPQDSHPLSRPINSPVPAPPCRKAPSRFPVMQLLCLLGSCCLQGTGARQYQPILTVPNGGPWGSRGHRKFCPSGYSKGFELKVQPFQGFWPFGDDTAVNSVRLLCWDGGIECSVGWWGSWMEAQLCSSSKLVSFSLHVERWQYLRDNTTVNIVRFSSSNGTNLEGWGLSGGHFGPWSSNYTSGVICGLQTKVEKPQGKWDDTALNDIRVFCCE